MIEEQLSNVIVVLVAFSSYYTLAYFLVGKFLSPTEMGQAWTGKFPLFFCLFGIAASFGVSSMLPFTVFANLLLNFLPTLQGISQFRWLSPGIVHELWRDIYVVTDVSLFVFLPIAYFCHEAGDFLGSWRKFKYISFNYVVLSLMLGGIFWVLHRSVSSLGFSTPDYLPFSYTLIALGGSAGGMLCITRGFTVLSQWNWLKNKQKIKVGAAFNEDVWKARLERLQIKRDALVRSVNSLKYSLDVYPEPSSYQELQKKLQSLNSKIAIHKNLSRVTSVILKRFFLKLSWKIFGYAYHLFNTILPCFIVLRSAIGLFDDNTLWGPQGENVINFLKPVQTNSYNLRLVHTCLDLLLVIYITIASFVGYFHVAWLKDIHPQLHSTTFYNIIFNTFLILVLSSSLPVTAKILGLRLENY